MLLAEREAEWLGNWKDRLIDWEFRRGFLHRVRLTTKTFLEQGDELFRLEPVQRFELVNDTNKELSGDAVREIVAHPVFALVRDCTMQWSTCYISAVDRTRQNVYIRNRSLHSRDARATAMRRLLPLGLLLTAIAAAAEDPQSTPKFDFAASAAKYEVEVRGSGKKCEPYQVDLLKWTNPIRGTVAGSVFLWTQGGIPEAACCMYAYPDNGDHAVDHELVSLTTEKIDVRFGGEPVWKTEAAGIAWKAIPKAPAPAVTRSARLVQMRNMAKTFAGYIGVPGKRRNDLRVLPQPIYRHPDTAEMDGGVFAFVQTTDPEVLLVMRVNRKAEPPAWEFAAARMTIVHAFLAVEEKVVWSVAWWEKKSDSTYITRSRVPFSVEK